MSRYKLSFQLYSARNFPPLDPVLEGLAEIGYDAVEGFLPNYGETQGVSQENRCSRARLPLVPHAARRVDRRAAKVHRHCEDDRRQKHDPAVDPAGGARQKSRRLEAARRGARQGCGEGKVRRG